MHSRFVENPPIDLEVSDPTFQGGFYHTRDPTSLHHKQHPEKSTTPCNRLPTTSNIPHLPACPITSLPKQPSPSPSLLPIILICHNQPPITFASSTNHILNVKQYHFSSQDRSQSCATTPATNPRTSVTTRHLSHPQHNPHNHQRFQYRF
jgi:hypothetical protein